MRPFDTGRWVGLVGLTLLAVGAGIVARHPPLVLVGAVGVGYAAHSLAGEAPEPALSATRTLSEAAPDPGEEVRVTLRVRNAGDETLPDLRLVDGVPDALEVTDGPARAGTALRPGASVAFSYSVAAVRGAHEWGPVRVEARNAGGSRGREASVDCETTMRCSPPLGAGGDLPLRGLTTRYAGDVPTDVGGSGVEFHSTREYRRGDPLGRVDWNRYARTGSLATLDLREERAATVVLLVDAREEAYLAPDASSESAVERSVDAAGRAFAALCDGGDRVGVAAFGSAECWLPPGAGAAHRARAENLLATHPALAPTPAEGQFFPRVWLRRFRRRLPADAQVVFFTPLTDEYAEILARRLEAYGHLVTVVSPDPTTDGSPGRTLAAVERENRLSHLRRTGIRVVDWGDEPLAATLARAGRRS